MVPDGMTEIEQVKEVLSDYVEDNRNVVEVVKTILKSYEHLRSSNLVMIDAVNKLMQVSKIKENLSPGETPDSIINRAAELVRNSETETKLTKQLISLRMPDANVEDKTLYDAVKGLVERASLEHTCRRELELHLSKISGKILTDEDLIKMRGYLFYLRCVSNDISKIAISEDGKDDVIYSLLDSVADNFERQILKVMESKYEESGDSIRNDGNREEHVN